MTLKEQLIKQWYQQKVRAIRLNDTELQRICEDMIQHLETTLD